MLVPTAHPQLNGNHLFATIKFIAYAVIAPFLLAVVLLSYVVVLADFLWFRLVHLLTGEPRVKGLWEF